MSIAVVNGAGTIAGGGTLTVTPGAGETWVITSLGARHSNMAANMNMLTITTDGTAPMENSAGAALGSDGGGPAHFQALPTGRLVITDTSPLKVRSQVATGYNYSGAKL